VLLCPSKNAPNADPRMRCFEPRAPTFRWFVAPALAILAAYILFCHGCHGDEDNELLYKQDPVQRTETPTDDAARGLPWLESVQLWSWHHHGLKRSVKLERVLARSHSHILFAHSFQFLAQRLHSRIVLTVKSTDRDVACAPGMENVG